VEESILSEVRPKIEAALDGQAGGEILTWACALVAARVPEPESPFAYEAATSHRQSEAPQLDPLPWEDDPIDTPEWDEETLAELRPTPAAPLPPAHILPHGAPTLDETARWGWQLVTQGGEQVWLTPAHLLAIEEAKPKLYGVQVWIPTLGFRSSPTPYEPVCDFYVACIVTPPIRVNTTAYYTKREYHHASRSPQHIVLAFAAKPEGLPW
jgi:hypothetical protein